MRIFLAGAAGAIGRPLVARLLADGHAVTGTTRDEGRASALRAQGAEAVVLDALDLQALRDAVMAAEPEAVIHQLTALPAQADPKAMGPALQLTNRLRRETVPLLLDAAREAGARRALVQSIAFVTRPDGRAIHDEDAPLYLDAPAEFRDSMAAAADLEAACATATAQGLDTIVLRYGFYYGPGTWYDRHGTMAELVRARRYPIIGGGAGRMSFVHIDDAVDATVRALTAGAPGIYNITDDDPAQARDWLPVLAQQLGAKPPRKAPAWLARRLAGDAVVHYATKLPGNGNDKARDAFTGWAPRAWRDGFAEVFG
jgi:nucleoside-diphosphate-sugar epimerase